LTSKHVFDIMNLEHTFGGDNMKIKKIVFYSILIILLCLFAIPHISKASQTKNTQYVKITVCSGDTLWAIASDYIDKNSDIREYIYNIKKINKLQSAMLTPGQELIIPCD
jgi:hypothetical protein